LLFTFAMRARERPDRPPLRIIGPAGEIERVLALAEAFLQTDRFPPVRVATELVPLAPGELFESREFRLETCASKHPVPGLCYRLTDRATGAVLVFTGDTAYDPSLAPLCRDAGLLVHEASYGARPAPAENASLHSGAPDAARVALEAGVKRLALIHCPRAQQETALAAARALFPATLFPEEGERVAVE
ncbi:MAG TPA: hypothetical protein VKT77_21015, partial [Chthonomonadaceae bacterium]|nr:hypothetical protein [Chthonomonadaceae bacterium]